MSRINTNVAANNAYRNLSATNDAVGKQIAKLSSGFRINRAADDAAGLAIANKLRNDGKALNQASRNAAQANAMLSIADGGAQTIAQILDRMKELATASASDTIGTQRAKLQDEFTALNDEIQRIVDTTKYQGKELLSGSGAGDMAVTGGTYTDIGSDIAKVSVTSGTAAGTYTLSSDATANGVVELSDGTTTSKVLAQDGAQTLSFKEFGVTVETGVGFKIGDGTDPASFDGKTITVAAGVASGTPFTMLVGASGDQAGADKLDVSLPALSKLTADDISTLSAAQTAMTDVDNMLDTVNTFIGKLGAAQSRMDFAQQNLATTIQNTAAAESTIRDADMAAEMTQFTKQQVLAQAGTAMLSQANQASQNVLSLLR